MSNILTFLSSLSSALGNFIVHLERQKIPAKLLLIWCVVVIFIFYPFALSFDLSTVLKQGVFIFGGIFSLAYISIFFFYQKIIFKNNLFYLSLLSAVLVSTVSALLSLQVFDSLVGLSFELDTLASILSFSLLIVASTVAFSNWRVDLGLFFSWAVGIGLLVPIVIAGIFYGNDVLQNIFVDQISLQILALMVIVVGCYQVDFNSGLTKAGKFLSLVTVLFAAVLIFKSIQLAVVLIGVGVISYLFILNLSNPKSRSKPIPLVTFFIGVFFLILLVLSFSQNNKPENQKYIDEVSDYKGALKVSFQWGESNHLFGFGPHTYPTYWDMYRPAGSYNSESNMANDYPPYIYNEPKYAFGLLPTITANTGVFGFMTWFLFLLMSLVLIGKKLRHGIGEYDYTAGASLISLCFILSILFIVPQVYLLAIGAIGLGIVAGGSSQHSSRLDLNRLVSTLRLLFTVLLISGAVFLIFFSASLMNSSILFQKAVDVWFYSNSSPLFYAEKTINLREVPEYYRLLGQVQFYTARNYLLNDSALSESDTALVKSLLAESVINISKAADLDPNDYRNWLLLGDINTFLYMFGAEDSAEFADIYYNKVIGLIHAQPYARLGLAQLSYLKGDFDMVEVNLNEALRIFPNWSEALELQDKSNALKEAIINAPVN